MSFPTPDQIKRKAELAYLKLLPLWCAGEDAGFFPIRVRISLKLDKQDPVAAIAAHEKLLSQSKQQRGWGYTVHRAETNSQTMGKNRIAKSITIDTLDDLLRLAKKKDEFAATTAVVSAVRGQLPALEPWLRSNIKSLHKIHESLEGLILVAAYFTDNPWPNCYARQIPVPVDTKFVQRNHRILRQWLDILLPPSGIDVNERKFERRFGLRDGQPHRGLRLLDLALREELNLSHEELSLPLRSIADLPMHNVTVFIVENRLNLLTLPAADRAIGIEGEGNAVNRLEKLDWLNRNRIIYWGDIDVEGFLILSRLRNLFENVESILMDETSLEAHIRWAVPGNGTKPVAPTNLTAEEAAAFARCASDNLRLEQEKIAPPYADHRIGQL